MVKYTIVFLLLVSVSGADMMKKKTLACPTVVQLQKAPVEMDDSSMDLSMYAIANNCMIIDKRDKVEAIGYDPTYSKEIYQKIIFKRTGTYLYVLRSTIQVEQDGKKSSMRF